MFERNENGKLSFNRLEFEIMVDDIIANIKPTNMVDLRWMIEKMIDSIQLCAYQYVESSDSFDDEWEDVFYPA